MNRRPLFGLLCLVLSVTGCNRAPYETALVSGQVTLNGKPIANVAVMFQPVAPPKNINPGPGSYGITDADGRYSLKVVGKETPGAVIGKHKVRFSMHREPGDLSDDYAKPKPLTGPQVPSRYYDIEGKMEFEVPPEGTTSADFPLTSP